jgi:hypothetical protein
MHIYGTKVVDMPITIVHNGATNVTMGLSKAQANAQHKGRTLASWVERVRFGTYRVPSQTEDGVLWTVIDTGRGLQCTCPAGMLGRPCAHKEAVLIRRQQEATKGNDITLTAPVRMAPRRVDLL